MNIIPIIIGIVFAIGIILMYGAMGSFAWELLKFAWIYLKEKKYKMALTYLVISVGVVASITFIAIMGIEFIKTLISV